MSRQGKRLEQDQIEPAWDGKRLDGGDCFTSDASLLMTSWILIIDDD
jgi:hypothetical protein